MEHLGSGVRRILEKYDASVFHFSENFLRIVYPYAQGYEFAESNGGVNEVFVYIQNHPLCRIPAIVQATGISERSIQRTIKALKAEGVIEFVGAPKTGGYRLIQ
jgi:predicted HTH transcriptional regulator